MSHRQLMSSQSQLMTIAPRSDVRWNALILTRKQPLGDQANHGLTSSIDAERNRVNDDSKWIDSDVPSVNESTESTGGEASPIDQEPQLMAKMPPSMDFLSSSINDVPKSMSFFSRPRLEIRLKLLFPNARHESTTGTTLPARALGAGR